MKEEGKGSAKAFGVTIEGWRPRERFPVDLMFTYPHPERVELAQRIHDLQGQPDQAAELERAKDRYDKLEGKFPVWDDNRRSLEAFMTVRTQWRTGVNGATGLDYNAVAWRVGRLNLGDEEEAVLQDIEIMEKVVLAEWAKERKAMADDLDRKRGRG